MWEANMRRFNSERPTFGIFCHFALDERGATAIEYGLMAALIALTIFGAASAAGQGIKSTLGQIVTALQQ
jgi:pilus assembly protein Flp/PilA